MAPRISSHLINRNCTFINQMYPPIAFIIHRTAGHVNCQQLYDYWQSTCISSHFGISYDGYGYDPHDIWQFVNLWDGSGANCCPESGHHWFFDRGGNANTYTITVEVCTPNTNNQGLMTDAQVEALVYLITHCLNELGIPLDHGANVYWNDYEDSHTWINEHGGVGMHRDVSPHNKRMCPGDPYYQGQIDHIISLVQGGGVVTPPWEFNKYMEQQFNNVWDSSPFGRHSGIYTGCLQAFTNGKLKVAVCPTTDEIHTVDWGGNPIIYQYLSNGFHAEYVNGRTLVYGQDGAKIVT